MFTILHIAMDERAVLLKDGIPIRPLEPGRHWVWSRRVQTLVFERQKVTFDTAPAVLEVIPPEWVEVVRLGRNERAFVSIDERPILFLRPGLHRLWKRPGLHVELVTVTDPVPALTDQQRALVPTAELLDVTVCHHERGLKYVNGRFEGQLEPGRHQFWVHAGEKVAVSVIDQRIQQLTIAGQELMTRDKVTLRLTLTVAYAPADLATTVHAVADVQAAIYLAVQLAARTFVAGVTLDELLEGRDALTNWLTAVVVPEMVTYGVKIAQLGVKDIILPGEMKILLNKVIEAEKAAAANVVLRRDEAAAARNLVQVAKTIAENPVLMRLKELEALKEMANKVGGIELHLGEEALGRLFNRSMTDNGA